MSMRKSLARKGLSLAKQAAQVFGLGPYTSAFAEGVGCAAGASLPYVAGALVLSAVGFKRTAGLVCIAGALDLSPMQVLSEE